MIIREIRDAVNMSQQELAQRVGVSAAYVSMLEKGNRKNPSLILLKKIASELGTTVDRLLQEKVG